MELSKVLIGKVPPKKVEKFEDPYKYDPSSEAALDTEAPVAPPTPEPVEGDAPVSFKYRLGKEHLKDSQGGDAGCICKPALHHPTVAFIRSQFCGRQQNSVLHQDVGSSGNSKLMKAYMVTTGFLVAYKNTFDVQIYNLQSPSKETTPLDYSQDYFSKILVQRKLNAKKKNEKTLSSLIRLIQQNGGKAPETEAP